MTERRTPAPIGPPGKQGVQGERGKQGDHGQHGEKGSTGARGAAGADAPYLNRNKTLALFSFVVLAFVLQTVRIEINTSEISENQHIACTSANRVLVKYNGLLEANIKIERTNKFIDDAVRKARIDAYTAARLELPVCENR